MRRTSLERRSHSVVRLHRRPALLAAGDPTSSSDSLHRTDVLPAARAQRGRTLLAVVNPDNDSVSFFDVAATRTRKLSEIRRGRRAERVALLPNGSRPTSRTPMSGTVPVLSRSARQAWPRSARRSPSAPSRTGSRLTPNGTKLYVTNARSNTVSVIDTATDTVIKTIRNVGFEPRGLAITNDGDADDHDETVYVTQFLSLPIAGQGRRARRRQGGPCDGDLTATDTVIGDVTLESARRHRLQGARRRAGAHPARHDVRLRDRGLSEPAQQHRHQRQLRLRAEHRRLAQRPVPLRRQHAEPAARDQPGHERRRRQDDQHAPGGRAQTNRPSASSRAVGDRLQARSRRGYVVSAASNIVVKSRAQSGDGRGHRADRPADPTRVLQIPTGKNPRGIVDQPERHARLRDELRLARCDGDRPDHVARAGHRDAALGGAAGAAGRSPT